MSKSPYPNDFPVSLRLGGWDTSLYAGDSEAELLVRQIQNVLESTPFIASNSSQVGKHLIVTTADFPSDLMCPRYLPEKAQDLWAKFQQLGSIAYQQSRDAKSLQSRQSAHEETIFAFVWPRFGYDGIESDPPSDNKQAIQLLALILEEHSNHSYLTILA